MPSLVALYQLVSHSKLIISLFPSFKVLKGDSKCGVHFLELPQEVYDSYGLTPEGLFSEAGSVGRADLRRDTASLLSCRGHPTFHCLLLCEMGVIMFCLLHRVNYKDQL